MGERILDYKVLDSICLNSIRRKCIGSLRGIVRPIQSGAIGHSCYFFLAVQGFSHNFLFPLSALCKLFPVLVCKVVQLKAGIWVVLKGLLNASLLSQVVRQSWLFLSSSYRHSTLSNQQSIVHRIHLRLLAVSGSQSCSQMTLRAITFSHRHDNRRTVACSRLWPFLHIPNDEHLTMKASWHSWICNWAYFHVISADAPTQREFDLFLCCVSLFPFDCRHPSADHWKQQSSSATFDAEKQNWRISTVFELAQDRPLSGFPPFCKLQSPQITNHARAKTKFAFLARFSWSQVWCHDTYPRVFKREDFNFCWPGILGFCRLAWQVRVASGQTIVVPISLINICIDWDKHPLNMQVCLTNMTYVMQKRLCDFESPSCTESCLLDKYGLPNLYTPHRMQCQRF